MVSGESHYFLGQRYRLRVIEEGGAPRLILRGKSSMDMFVRPGTTQEKKQEILHAFYRAELKSSSPSFWINGSRSLTSLPVPGASNA